MTDQVKTSIIDDVIAKCEPVSRVIPKFIDTIPKNHPIHIIYNLLRNFQSKVYERRYQPVIYGGAIRDYLAEVPFTDIDIGFKLPNQIFQFLNFLSKQNINVEANFDIPKENEIRKDCNFNMACYPVTISGPMFNEPIKLDLVVRDNIPFHDDFTINNLHINCYEGDLVTVFQSLETVLKSIKNKKLFWCGITECRLIPGKNNFDYDFLKQEETKYKIGFVYTFECSFTPQKEYVFSSGKYIERLHKMIQKGYSQPISEYKRKNKKKYSAFIKHDHVCGVCQKSTSDVLTECGHVFCCECLYKLYSVATNAFFEEKKNIQIENILKGMSNLISKDICEYTKSHNDDKNSIDFINECFIQKKKIFEKDIAQIKNSTPKSIGFVNIQCPCCAKFLLTIT